MVPNSPPRCADELAHLVVQLAGERAGADARRVGLGDAPDFVDGHRADAGADACRARQRVGGGHERIGAVVDVEHRALRALEDHLLAVVEHLPHQLGGVRDVLLEAVAEGEVFLGHRVQVERRVLLIRAQRQPLGLHRGDDLLLEDLLVEQVLDADPQARGLVGVAGADAAAGRADLQAAEFRLSREVQEHVVGHDQVRVGGDAQAADVHAPRAQVVELVDEHLRVDHDAVADHAELARVEDPRGDQVELPLFLAADDRVAGVVAALEAHDGVAVLGQEIGDLPLALIAPLGAD